MTTNQRSRSKRSMDSSITTLNGQTSGRFRRCGRIYAFWRAALWHTDAFIDKIETVKLSVAEWRRQRAIYQRGSRKSILQLGFATFYLNRCNRSGIIASGGPIGGLDQTGKWKIDARFNRSELAQRAFNDCLAIVVGSTSPISTLSNVSQ